MGTVESIYLFQLAKDKSPDGRKSFGKEISQVFLENFPSLTKRERALMFEILQQLMRDVEMSLRKSVSRQLAEEADVPRELAMLLANDEIEVAFPILTMSPVLFDEDLVEIVRNRTVEHQFAVTKRPLVGETVTDALVEKGEESVIRSLLLNPNAQISSKTMEYLAEESKRVSGYQEPILHRDELDPALAERMFSWVSSALRQYIMDNHELDPAYVDEVLENAVLQEVEGTGGGPRSGIELTEELAREGELTPDMLVLAMQNKEARLFITMFRRYTDIPESVIMEMLADFDGTGLAIACKSADLGKSVFSSIYGCIRKSRPGGSSGLRQDIRRLIEFYDRISLDSAANVAVQWRNNVGYRPGINNLEF